MSSLDILRGKVDSIDNRLLKLLSKRFTIASRIGELKRSLNLAITDKNREEAVLERRTKEGKQLGMSEEFIRKIFDDIFSESKRIQKSNI